MNECPRGSFQPSNLLGVAWHSEKSTKLSGDLGVSPSFVANWLCGLRQVS